MVPYNALVHSPCGLLVDGMPSKEPQHIYAVAVAQQTNHFAMVPMQLLASEIIIQKVLGINSVALEDNLGCRGQDLIPK